MPNTTIKQPGDERKIAMHTLNDSLSVKTLALVKLVSPRFLRRAFLFISLALGCFALAPQAQAACQEGCFTNGNTVLGNDALLNRNGIDNTAIGFQALNHNNGTANYNTAIGFVALATNTSGDQQHRRLEHGQWR
jgi:hypothetical protein